MRPLDIVLEVGLNADAMRGIDYYIANVVNALAGIDRVNRYAVFSYFFRDYRRKRARLPLPEGPNFEALVRRFPERWVRLVDRRWGLPLVQSVLLGGRRPDVYHVVGGGSLPHLSGPKSVVTFFDLAEEAFPHDGSRPEPGRRIHAPATFDIARRADCLLATGEYTKRDLMRYYGIPEGKIAVIPTGVNDQVFRPVRDPAALNRARERYRLPERYLMMIGPYQPPRRNNADVVFQAFAEMRRSGAAGGCRLVLVGRGAEPLREAAARLGLADAVQATGFVELADLPAIYALSSGVVHPTSVEGFGYGLEVLACGAALITSDLPGVVEAVADAALTVPPRAVEPLRQAMADLLGKPGLKEELVRRGLERAAGFSYQRVAERILGLYERLAR